ncbi:alkaline phosphatase family protein [Aciduliprofundum sp. MAR08-339]|uniref:alkaline phosphatase family protein n=1 Tax=Aciduliprofundum sp. (strain MAR08-339) TaxID=673860 RepID=UPI000A03C242
MFKNEEWDLFFIHFITSDIISHKYFGDMLKRTPLSIRALDIFKNIDKHIGWFLSNLPKETLIFILSDHGFYGYI